MITSTTVTFAGLRLFLLALFCAFHASVKGEEICKDNHSKCPTFNVQCATSEAIRILCKKTCKICVEEPSAATLSETVASTALSLDTSNLPKTYVGFVVDDTGSMGNEIGGVKLWIEACLSGELDECGEKPTGGWVITSFNDPGIGAVVGPTMNTDNILKAARSYGANGGGDCPEMAFGGLEVAGNAVPDENGGCKVFFFTDATAKDYNESSSVIKMYGEKGCSFTSILTNCCGDCPPPEDTVGSEYASAHVADSRKSDRLVKRSTVDEIKTLFYKVSEKTGGNIYLMDKPTSPEVMLEFLKEVTLGFCPTSDIAGPIPGGYKCEEDCKAMKMCWDKSISKCYCTGEIPCARTPVRPSGSPCPEWAAWSPWSVCSLSCGSGTRQREKKCSMEGQCRHMPTETHQTEECNVEPCLEWSNWGSWGECSKSCREGERTRARSCGVPEKCSGNSEQTEKCTVEKTCPGDGTWSKCSRSCGDGTRRRYFCHDDDCAWDFEVCNERRCPDAFCPLFPRMSYSYGVKHKCCSLTNKPGEETCGHGVTRKPSYGASKWPWMAAIHTNGEVCGGVLISPNFVLSTARCFTSDSGVPKNTTDWRIIVGSQKLSEISSSPGSALLIKKTFIHPEYIFPVADIALIELQHEVTFTRAIRPICLPGGENTEFDVNCISTGWRSSALTESRTDLLQELSISNYDPLVCAAAYRNHKDLETYVPFLKRDKGYMCAGSLTSPISNCPGVGGGPLMCQRCSSCSWYVAGISSFGPNVCSLTGVPAVYSKVAYYEDWIFTTAGIDKHLVRC